MVGLINRANTGMADVRLIVEVVSSACSAKDNQTSPIIP